MIYNKTLLPFVYFILSWVKQFVLQFQVYLSVLYNWSFCRSWCAKCHVDSEAAVACRACCEPAFRGNLFGHVWHRCRAGRLPPRSQAVCGGTLSRRWGPEKVRCSTGCTHGWPVSDLWSGRQPQSTATRPCIIRLHWHCSAFLLNVDILYVYNSIFFSSLIFSVYDSVSVFLTYYAPQLYFSFFSPRIFH